MKKLLVSLFFLITTLLFAEETTQTKGAYVDTSLLGKFSQVLGSSLIENTVVIILVAFFAIVIFIIFYKYSYLKQTQKQSKTKKVMKKQTSKISLKTDKIVSLSKEQVQSVVGGRYSDTVTTGKSRCWCRD